MFRLLQHKLIRKIVKFVSPKLLGEKGFLKIRTIYWIKRLKRGVYYERELDLLHRFIGSGEICIDIGANFGQYTYPLSKLVGPNGKVFSFEPSERAFEILKNVVSKLKLTNVKIQKIALSDKEGELDFVITFGGGYLRGQNEKIKSKIEKVKVTTLDRLSERGAGFNKAVFVKCDVDGTELLVFKGGKNLLVKSHPIILCEIIEECTRRHRYEPKEVFAFLESLGYKGFIFTSGILKPVRGTQPPIYNYIFIPKKRIAVDGNLRKIF